MDKETLLQRLQQRYCEDDFTEEILDIISTFQKTEFLSIHKFNFEKMYIQTSELYEQGNAVAQIVLAYMYDYGEYVKKDVQKAFELYTLSANQGNSNAQYKLANMYEKGTYVEQDYEKAFELYTLSENQGNANAQNNLGYMYQYGKYVEQDVQKAFELYILSVNQGNANAQNNLGVMYSKGIYTEQDIGKAIELYTLAAQQGLSTARNNLKSLMKSEKYQLYLCSQVTNLTRKYNNLLEEIQLMPGGSDVLYAHQEFIENAQKQQIFT